MLRLSERERISMMFWLLIQRTRVTDGRRDRRRAGLRHVRGVRQNRAAKFKGAAILDPTKINLPGMACIFVNSLTWITGKWPIGPSLNLSNLFRISYFCLMTNYKLIKWCTEWSLMTDDSWHSPFILFFFVLSTKKILMFHSKLCIAYVGATYAQYTPPTPTRRNCRVGDVNTPVGSRDPVYNFLCWQLTSDDIMTSLLKKKL